MHRELARAIPELGPGAEGLTLHVGVNSGHAIARVMGSEARLDYGVLGDAVIVAQRLESQAPGGETYVGASTLALVGDRFRLESVGELAMKGKAEPVPAWRLLGEARTAGPAGRGPTPRPDSAFVGRTVETRRIAEALDAAAGGAGGLVTVTGEPGVGKSTFVGHAEALAADRGIAWLRTRCASFGRAISYGPFAILLRERAGIEVEDSPSAAGEALGRMVDAEELDAHGGPFARLLGLEDGDPAAETLGPEAFQRALHAAFVAWLARPGSPARVLLVEDVHWIDQASLALITELAGAAVDAGLLLILTGRAEAGATFATLAALPAVGAVPILLEPFDAEDTADLVARQIGESPAPALVTFVHDRTAGNPFFVGETVRALREQDALAPGRDGIGLVRGWDTTTVPPTIEGVLAARIDRLPTDDREVLQVASVVGRRIRTPLLDAVLDPASGSSVALDRLVDAGLMDRLEGDPDHQVAFHHALVQDVAYGRMLRRRRRELHGRAADAMERLYGTGDDVIDVLARHLYLARAGDRAVAALSRAAERAAGFFANDEAILALERAAEVLGSAETSDSERLHEIRLRLAGLYERIGRYPEALAAYGSVREAVGAPLAWLGLARTHRSLGAYETALRTIDDAMAALPATADQRPFLLERARALAQTGRVDEAVAAARTGIALATDTEAAVTGHLLLQLARARTVAGAADEAIGYAEEAVAILDRQRDVPGLAGGYRTLGYAFSRAGKHDQAEGALLRGLEFAERTGSSDEIGGTLINLGVVAMYRERAADAVDWDRRAIAEFERIGHGSGRVTGYANLAHALAELGDLATAEVTARQAVDLARQLGHALAVADALDTLAGIAHRRGDDHSAASQEEEAAVAYVAAGAMSRAGEAYEQAATWWGDAGDATRASAATAESLALVKPD